MPKPDVTSIIEEFVENAVIQGDCTYRGDYKRGNRASKKLFALREVMKRERTIAYQALDVLLKHENVSVRIWAAGTALDLGYRAEDAAQTLRGIANMPGVGILGFNAEMCLKVRNLL